MVPVNILSKSERLLLLTRVRIGRTKSNPSEDTSSLGTRSVHTAVLLAQLFKMKNVYFKDVLRVIHIKRFKRHPVRNPDYCDQLTLNVTNKKIMSTDLPSKFPLRTNKHQRTRGT